MSDENKALTSHKEEGDIYPDQKRKENREALKDQLEFCIHLIRPEDHLENLE